MTESCKCILDKMVYKGAMTPEEREKILRNLNPFKPTIICANANCKYNNERFECVHKGPVPLIYEHVNTVNDGNRSFLTCKKSLELCPQTKIVRIKDIEQPLIIDMDDPEDLTKGIHLYY